MIRVLAATLVLFPGVNAADSEELYVRCAACHLADGSGIPGVFPPLKDRLDSIAATTPGRDYVVMTVIGGLIGVVEMDGIAYRGVMPAQGLSDAEIAGVLNYIVSSMSTGIPESWQDFSEAEVAEIRQRHPQPTGQTVLQLREKVPGLASRRSE